MEPPRRPLAGRRFSQKIVASANSSSKNSLDHLASDTTNLSRGNGFTQELKLTERVGLDWEEESSRFQIEAECIETKTVTTTTTTKRSYPPLLVRPPRSLEALDTKDYPLAKQPIPDELLHLSYMVGEQTSRSLSENVKPSTNSSVLPLHEALEPSFDSRLTRIDHEFETPSSRPPRHLQQAADIGEARTRSRVVKAPRSPDSLGPASTKSTARLFQHQRRGQRSVSNSTIFDGPQSTTSRLNEVSALDLQDLDGAGSEGKLGLSFMSSTSEESTMFEDAPSPSILAAHSSHPSAVATPPITETDLEPFDHVSRALSEAGASRPTLNTAGIQNASLPSPSLSPTIAAAKLHDAQFGGYVDERDSPVDDLNQQDALVAASTSKHPPYVRDITVVDAQNMLTAFDTMPDELKSLMMVEFLRRCPRKTLHHVAKVVNPSLKLDFFELLPAELSLHIISFFNHKDLCRAAQVSKRWRSIVDENEAGWKELLEKDKFILPEGELDKAIVQGWGWQDPYGLDGHEKDLSSRPSSQASINKGHFDVPTTSTRSSIKRKRVTTSVGREHSKRSKDFLDGSRSGTTKSVTVNLKSDGPVGASTAAVMAVPNPELGLPSLQKMHLYKSLYRRRYMLQRNWMNEKMKPYHMAFPAHPRHVITCLQFDDDKIITGSDDTFIHVYDTKTGRLRKRLEGHEGGVWALQYEGNVLVSGSTDRSVRVWDIERGVCTQVFQGHTSTVRCLQIVMPVATGKIIQGKPQMMPEKPLIITGSRDSHLRVWHLPEAGSKKYMQNGPASADTDCPYFVRVLTGHAHSVRAIAAHSDILVSGSYDNTVRVWKISTGEIIHVLRGHAQKVYSVVLDMERGRCISGSMDNSVKIWSLETGDCLYTLEGHTSLVGLLDLQDDRLVSAAADSTLRIWDPANGQCKSTLTAHTGAITCFQHDGTKVISGSDRTLKMWNVKTGECLQDLLVDLTGVWQVRFDERRCVAAVQRDGNTFLEVLDFGASRDGIPASERGWRQIKPASDVDRVPDDGIDVLDN